jgi:hypothetical protein
MWIARAAAADNATCARKPPPRLSFYTDAAPVRLCNVIATSPKIRGRMIWPRAPRLDRPQGVHH